VGVICLLGGKIWSELHNLQWTFGAIVTWSSIHKPQSSFILIILFLLLWAFDKYWKNLVFQSLLVNHSFLRNLPQYFLLYSNNFSLYLRRCCIQELIPIKHRALTVFGASILKTYWNIVGYDFIQCVLEFFRTGCMLKEINQTFITLISKKGNPSQTSQYRQISLSSTIYKTIAKILVNRMRPLLDKLVSPYQSASIPWTIHSW